LYAFQQHSMTDILTGNEPVMGIDIGGSHITAAMANLATGELLNGLVIRRPVDRHATAEVILNTWSGVITDLWNAFGLTGGKVGFAMPGPFDYKEGVSLIKGFDKYEALYQLNIRQQLSQRLQLPPEHLLFRNDAEAFLEGEVFYGAAKGYSRAIGITLGTGLGSAVFSNGVCRDAELSVLPYKGERIEDFVSTRGLLRNYQQLSGQLVKDARVIAERVAGDAHAAEAFRLFGTDLTWFLQQFIQQEHPDILVIGGNIAQAWPLFSAELLQGLAASVTKMPAVVMAALGEHAALLGGAHCFAAR